ncbi:MAG: hypothetical protein JO270_19080 [Acidobacteriaceae bacterium]|nr:hypothetical protein [Acidobacteriaceae bacterium]
MPPRFCAIAAAALFIVLRLPAQSIPKTWDDAALATSQLKPPIAGASIKPVPASYYYKTKERVLYRVHPVYSSKTEPPGYLDKLAQTEPELTFNESNLKTDQDWIAAGREVFRYPVNTGPASETIPLFRGVLERCGVPPAKDGTYPQLGIIVPRKGVVLAGFLSCATCHTRIQPDGSVIEGAQGSLPDTILGFPPELEKARTFQLALYRVPWLKSDPINRVRTMSVEEISAAKAAIPLGVVARHGSSLFTPVQIPDLIGVRDRKYLDHTGLMRQRDIGDLMRYAALNAGTPPAGMDMFADYSGFVPIETISDGAENTLPAPETVERFSDAQLYALAKFIYSLTPPANPNHSSPLIQRGEKVFAQEGCPRCHTPPLYTSNRLTLAIGFTPPPEDSRSPDILRISVGTDPDLTMKTRRGTGYYKVPSLKGVWYRGMFGHSGWCATLEDWFDPRRLRNDYVPTGFKPFGARTYAVRGHPFGLDLSREDRAALIAFLKTL